MLKEIMKKAKVPMISASLVAFSVVTAFADATTPTSMLSDDVKNIVKDFTADLIPTIMDLIALIIPTALTIWGIGFAVKKGIGFLQRKAKASI